jgi:hypothetical protein
MEMEKVDDKTGKVITPGGPRDENMVIEIPLGKAVERTASGEHVVVAETQSNMVVTPGGYRSPSLVHEIEPGHVLDGSGGQIRKIERVTGAEVANFGPIARRDESRPLMPANVHVPADKVPGQQTLGFVVRRLSPHHSRAANQSDRSLCQHPVQGSPLLPQGEGVQGVAALKAHILLSVDHVGVRGESPRCG